MKKWPKEDLLAGCIQDVQAKSKGKVPISHFKEAWCKHCKQRSCVHARWGESLWTSRMDTQVDRLLDNPNFADPNDPRFDHIRSLDFPQVIERAIQLSVSAQKGDWSIPETPGAPVQTQTEEMVEQAVAASEREVSPPVEPPVEEKTLSFNVMGARGGKYVVTYGEEHRYEETQYDWACTCRAYKYGTLKGQRYCKHILEAQRQAPQVPAATPAPVSSEVPSGPRPSMFIPTTANTPFPVEGVMVDDGGSFPASEHVPQAPQKRPQMASWPTVVNTVAVGGTVKLGGGDTEDQ